MNNKKAAMEMSIGTIVTIVLSMTLLIGGIMLVTNISGSGNDIVDMSTDQITNQLSQMFGEDNKLVMYPNSGGVDAKIDEKAGFLFGIKNTIEGTSGMNLDFSYKVVVEDVGNCGMMKSEIADWITLGETGVVPIAPRSVENGKVVLTIPDYAPKCNFRLRVNVKANDMNYATGIMDVYIK